MTVHQTSCVCCCIARATPNCYPYLAVAVRESKASLRHSPTRRKVRSFFGIVSKQISFRDPHSYQRPIPNKQRCIEIIILQIKSMNSLQFHYQSPRTVSFDPQLSQSSSVYFFAFSFDQSPKNRHHTVQFRAATMHCIPTTKPIFSSQ